MRESNPATFSGASDTRSSLLSLELDMQRKRIVAQSLETIRILNSLEQKGFVEVVDKARRVSMQGRRLAGVRHQGHSKANPQVI